jgi:hypothetical protein
MSGGGGGAGGYRTGTGFSVSAGTTYSITVGAGGASVNASVTNGNVGSNSVFSQLHLLVVVTVLGISVAMVLLAGDWWLWWCGAYGPNGPGGAGNTPLASPSTRE